LKYISFSFILILFALSACKYSEKILETTQDENVAPLKNPWAIVNFKPEKGLVVPTNYTTYQLNQKIFQEQLLIGMAHLPDLNGDINLFEVKDSGVMTEALQNKFPNIKSYAGFQITNKLCQSRIDIKNDIIKMAVQCNDKTYYIQDLHNLGLYFVYDKKDLPDGLGSVKE
jgi:hypothetical protein